MNRWAFLVVLVASATLAASSPASAHDGHVRQRFWAGLVLVSWADEDLRACYGCSDALADVQEKALFWSAALGRLTSHPTTSKGRVARRSGALGLLYYGQAGFALSRGDETGYDFYASLAVRKAWTAARLIGIGRGTFHALMVLRGCPLWQASLYGLAAPCDY